MSQKLVTTFQAFIKDIVDVFPEYKTRLTDHYKECFEKDGAVQKINEFLDNIKGHYSKIAERDETLFNDDPIFIPNISFKMMWNSGISDNTKDSIWKYLQCFCIMHISEDSSGKIEDVMKSIQMKEKVKDKQTVEQMKILKKLNESISKNNTQEMDESTMEDINNVLGDTKIGQIAKKISDEINIEDMMGGKDGGNIEDLFKGDNMAKIFSAISSNIGSMEQSGDLLSEATNICGVMKDNPLFSNMMNMGMEGNGGDDVMGKMMQGMMGGLMGNMSQPQPQPQPQPQKQKQINQPNHTHDPNVQRERLQQKLKNRQNMNNPDVD